MKVVVFYTKKTVATRAGATVTSIEMYSSSHVFFPTSEKVIGGLS